MPRTKLPVSWLLFSLVTLYSLAQLWWYLDTPLGKSPVLDGQENLLLAQKIADGTLEKAPFFRAMLYPATLAFLPLGHSLLGLICHLANTLLAAKLAKQFWKSEQAGLLAAALAGFNPVLLHFAFDPLDTTLAITFFLAALATLQSSQLNKRVLPIASAGLLIALATLTRPHFLLTIFAIATLLVFGYIKKRVSLTRLSAFAAGVLIPFLAIGFVQQNHSGNFRIMPTQGAYNLWVSNSPSANGLYYRQTLSFHSLETHENPNQVEGRLLYEQAHGKPGTIEERNSYWKSRTIHSVQESPLRWIKLEAFKLYASLNNFEQYNNKTYSFHKNLSPYLRYNPIGWGVLLIIASFCTATLWRQIKSELTPLLLVSLSILVGLLIFMASARFRLPLVPLVSVLAAGLPVVIPVFKASSWMTRRNGLIAASIATLIAFTQFSEIASTKTYLQDSLLLADASAKIGDDTSAIKWANNTLKQAPNHQQALRIKLISLYNQIATGESNPDHALWQDLLVLTKKTTLQDELLSFIKGVVLWNNNDSKQAIQEWNDGYRTYGLSATSCLAALELVGKPIPEVTLPIPPVQFFANGQHRLYAYAIAKNLSEENRNAFLQNIGFSTASYQSLGTSMDRIVPTH